MKPLPSRFDPRPAAGEKLEVLRLRLASVNALPQLSILGILCGLLAGGVTLLFRVAIDWPQIWLLPGGVENFEGLAPEYQAALPIIGALIIGAGFHYLSAEERRVGVAHVMERLTYHQGFIHFRNTLVQFLSGAVAIITGHSIGREAPAIHLGAGVSSLLGQWMQLPNNSIRTLVACGTAAAISASFNTPIAGVIFAIEVVMLDFALATYIPIILASVTGAIMTQATFGNEPAFHVPELKLSSLLEIPALAAAGVVIGCLAAALIYGIENCLRRSHQWPIFSKILLAGVITSACALLAPQVLGIGYDTVNQTLVGELALGALVLILVCKMVASATAIGLGIPGGIIGPTLVIGALAGGIFGAISTSLFPEHSASPGFYALVGMGAMMGATLQAPLSALMALLELTQNPNIIFPGMLVIVIACLVASEVFKRKSVFLTILRAQGLDYRSDPLSQSLYRAAVGAVLDRSFQRHTSELSIDDAKNILASNPRWLIVDDESGPAFLMPVADLARHVRDLDAQQKIHEEQEKSSQDEADNKTTSEQPFIPLKDIPAERKDLAPIELGATLREALDILESTGAEALYARRMSAPMIHKVHGIVTRKDIERYYKAT